MLNILILDDLDSKVSRIEEVLSRYDEIPNQSWQVCTNSRDAKIALRQTEYDLLILDIQIPIRQGETPQLEGGVDLLREIHTRSGYKKPTCIIGLTEHPELIDKVDHAFSDRLWSLVLYSASTTEWSVRLGNKIEYLIEKSRAENNGTGYAVDLGIITALDVPEFQGLISLSEWQANQVNEDSTHYWKTTFSAGEKNINVVAAHAPQMGMPATSVAATKMIYQFRPKYLAMVGISAGIPEQTNIGDLVVADPCWDWGNGKFISTPTGSQFAPDPMQERLHPFIRALFADVKRDSSLLTSLWEEYPGSKPAAPPQLHIGPCASGASVLADEQIRDGIREHSRKLVGIDMEAYGLLLAAAHSSSPSPKAFSIKAVCDFADADKNDGFQEYGSWMSAAVLRGTALKYF
jgi:nucleoside phosphorylase/CheY-like chemotaxis protein